MDGLIGLGILILISIPISVVYLLFSHAKLKQRVTDLERQLIRKPVVQETAPDEKVPPATVRANDTAAASNPWETARETTEIPAAPQPEPTREPPETQDSPPRNVVFSADKASALVAWLTQNWFYAVSAVSLALAGIFLVQYGIEQGLLPPWLRVTAALAFGAALVGAGEFIRRRYGDGEDSSTAYLPSTFSGAGIVTLFGAVLSARTLYGLIGPEVALIGMGVVGAIALVLGWFYGPLLAAIGIIGAMAAPFVVGGSSSDPSWLLAYFAIITIVGLAIDTVRRWAWVSVIALVLGFGAGWLLTMGAPRGMTEPYFVMYALLLALAAIAIPVRNLRAPDHAGTSLSMTYFARQKDEPWPEFPTRLAGGSVLAASGLIAFVAMGYSSPDIFWTAIIILTALILALLIWARNAPAIADLVVFPAGAVIAIIFEGTGLWRTIARAAAEPEADMPLTATVLVAIGILISAAAAWRSLNRDAARNFTAVSAAIFAPVVAIVIEVSWAPATVLGNYVWALHAMAIAALMVVMAERFARADGPDDRLRVSMAMLSALASIAFALVLLFSSAALTTALAVTIVAAAWLDRQFNLPLMGVYILAGVTTIGYRLVIDPGLDWAFDAPLFEMLLSHGGAVLAFAAAWLLARDAKRPRSEVLLESAVFSSTGILLSVLMFRMIDSWGGLPTASHWSFGLNATIWICLGFAQMRRMSLGGALRALRIGLAVVFFALAGLELFVATSLSNPLFYGVGGTVFGPPLLNTLMPAYLLPAIVLYLGTRWLGDMHRWIKLALQTISVALAALWLGLTIRHFWRGAEGMRLPQIDQPELYSYTVALLVTGAVLFYRSLASNSPILRKAGLAVIGLAVAKVFLIDIAGLGGLIRVFSLLFLGLSLAGLAWLNRWADGQISAPSDEPD